jgi:hypothetical protein
MKTNYKSFGMKYSLLTLAFAIVFSSLALAKTPVSDDGGVPADEPNPPAVQAPAASSGDAAGEAQAQKYFQKKKDPAAAGQKDDNTVSPNEHYLAIHLGGFLSSDAYQWGATPHVSSAGRLQGGVTYRMGELGKLADWALRADFIGYQLPEGTALNMSVLPMILFPDAASTFPVYFGIGIGPGVFLSQITNESTLSLNYELVGGVRFFNVIGNTGFFVETGLKNEIHLLSDGQFNGFFLSLGALFVF